MNIVTLITSICLVSAWACNKDRAQPSRVPDSASQAHARGLANAEAMVANARACEPEDRPVDIQACEKACSLNHSNSCANWGQLLASRDLEAARVLYDRACKGGSGIGCEARARLAAQEQQEDVEARFSLARDYHRVHCGQGYARSCFQLAALYREGLGGGPDPETATEFELQACKLGRQSSCLTSRPR